MGNDGSQSPMEQASCSQRICQVVFIFDTISKRSQMITTNGRVNSPSATKGTCPSAGNWIHTQLPVPDCGLMPLSCASKGCSEWLGAGSPHSCPKCLDKGHSNLNPLRGSCPLRLKSSLLLLAPKPSVLLELVHLIHFFIPIA